MYNIHEILNPEVAGERSSEYVLFARTQWRSREVGQMPARTVVPPRTGLVAHVPVDRVEMVLGPGAIKCMEAQAELQAHADDPEPFYVELDFTLRTAASESAFRRTLKMATIFYVRADLGTFQFTALFSGCIVSGVYNMKDRTGWFTLD